MKFYTNGLLSKWGFEDGDQLIEYTYASYAWGAPQLCDRNDLLVAVVRKFVLPHLVQRVEVYEIGGSHNPIRAKSVDGVEFDNHYDTEQPDLLTPSVLEVDDEEIRSLAMEISTHQPKGEQ